MEWMYVPGPDMSMFWLGPLAEKNPLKPPNNMAFGGTRRVLSNRVEMYCSEVSYRQKSVGCSKRRSAYIRDVLSVRR